MHAFARATAGCSFHSQPTQKEIRMKRFHVHVGVRNLDDSIRFYTGLFGAEPSVRKADYAKWMIEDPRINFAISQREGRVGVNHLGLQADSADELAAIRTQFSAAGASVVDETGVNCCYAKSDKHWVADPQGIAWEGYRTLGEVAYFDGDAAAPASCGAGEQTTAAGCCGPTAAPEATTISRACCS
jgi:catechol 2,3-dioxygenase-like lactoylglutathione lyase family enzyme